MIVVGFVALAIGGTLARWQLAERLPAPIGTLLANLAGSFGLGLIAGAGGETQTMLGVAGFGALTTFSTLMIELLEMWRSDPRRAVTYGAVSLVGSIGAAWAGLTLA